MLLDKGCALESFLKGIFPWVTVPFPHKLLSLFQTVTQSDFERWKSDWGFCDWLFQFGLTHLQ